VTIDPYSPPAGRKAELLRWLTEEGRFAPDTGRLLELLCNKLAALGIPIARATAHVRTLHPEYRGAALTPNRHALARTRRRAREKSLRNLA
jgi:adenylate cyclase